MTDFEKACLLSCENWVDTFPNEVEKHKFSKKHNEIINNILVGKPFDKKHKLSKKTVKILLIAAILLSLATTVLAFSPSREFIVKKFANHSEYDIIDTDDVKNVTSLKVNYIPSGFVRTEEDVSNDYYVELYSNGNYHFMIEKLTIDTNVGYDTEKYCDEEIIINDIKAVIYTGNKNIKGIIFNNGEYIYVVDGNIEKEELVRIAQNIE